MPAPIDLDRLLELWQAPRPVPEAPASPPPTPEEAHPRLAPAAPVPAPRAEAPPPPKPPDPPGVPPPDPITLLAALKEAVAQAWGQESKEFAIVGDLLETGAEVTTMSATAKPPRIGDLVRALSPAGGPPLSAEDRARVRADLAGHLDRLEDLLDAFLIAMDTR